MDRLAQRLREDAERIDVEVSAELERRIDASLRAVTPERPVRKVAPRPAHSPVFWWASTLTGAAAAVAVIVVVNRQPTVEQPAVLPATQVAEALPPPVDLNAQAAMLTGPLHEELENLESDLRKAEEKVRRDIGL